MLATPAGPAGLPRDGDRWAYEVKWDGMRVLADLHDGQLRLTSRTGRDVTVAFPELHPLAEAYPDVLLDGEVIVLTDGVPSFAALADRMHVAEPRRASALSARSPATLIVFDLLRLSGVDLTGQTWQQRREALDRLALAGPAWQVSPCYDDPELLLQATGEQGLEGVVAKRRNSRYLPGVRSADWVKFAHQRTMTCLVGGWRAEVGTRQRIGALLLGAWTAPAGDAPRLRFVGRVGSGIDAGAAAELERRFAALRLPHAPFDPPVPREDADGAFWVRPEVVVEVRFHRRTDSGRLRHPVYLGIRPDADPAQVRDDQP